MGDDSAENRTSGSIRWTPVIRYGLYSVVISAALFVFCYLGFLAYITWFDNTWLLEVVREHVSAVFGVPLAAVTAFFLVALLEIRTGRIEIVAWRFELRGASGPVVLWIAAFLAIVTAIKMLW